MVSIKKIALILLFSTLVLGSCKKEEEGCTYYGADNYDSSAEVDDGSCYYSSHSSSGSTSGNTSGSTTSGTGGSTSGGTSGGTATDENGQVSFYTIGDNGCGNISITVSGYGTKTLSQYLSYEPSSCGGSGMATWSLEPGYYSYNASCSEYTWSGSFTIYEGGCLTYELSGGTSSGAGGSTSGGTSGTTTPTVQDGQISFYTIGDSGCGNISITVSGYGSKTLSQYFSYEPSSCGGSGMATWSLEPGSYSYNASCSEYTWSGSFTIYDGGCLTYELK
jgi:hypothetical protein